MNNSCNKLKLGVIFGGRSGEHEISLLSAHSVINALDPEKYIITQIGITHNGTWLVGKDILEKFSKGEDKELLPATILPDPSHAGLYTIQSTQTGEKIRHLTNLDVVFPVLHGTFGEDGTIQGLFEMAGVAYVGAGVLGSSLGMDKGVFKDVMRSNNIPVVESIVVSRPELSKNIDRVINEAEKLAPYPLFTKPANLGSSVGVTKCRTRSDLMEGLLDSARYDRRILVERGVNAREIEVSVLGNYEPIASIPGEIKPADDFYSYNAKYHDGRSELIIPAPLTPEKTAYVRELAIRAYMAIDCAGMARVDFLLDKDNNELYVSEVNTIPGFTKISMYPKLWEASGIPYSQLVDRLIELAMERKTERDNTEWRYRR